jgi:hypothetical protein
VVWTRLVGSGAEQQVGLEADAQRDLWGLETNAPKGSPAPAPPLSNHASAGASR